MFLHCLLEVETLEFLSRVAHIQHFSNQVRNLEIFLAGAALNWNVLESLDITLVAQNLVVRRILQRFDVAISRSKLLLRPLTQSVDTKLSRSMNLAR